jgi:hypothetical protein
MGRAHADFCSSSPRKQSIDKPASFSSSGRVGMSVGLETSIARSSQWNSKLALSLKPMRPSARTRARRSVGQRFTTNGAVSAPRE